MDINQLNTLADQAVTAVQDAQARSVAAGQIDLTHAGNAFAQIAQIAGQIDPAAASQQDPTP